MIDLARRFVPQADLHVLQDGRSGLPDGCASLVYSYAVVQHISTMRTRVWVSMQTPFQLSCSRR